MNVTRTVTVPNVAHYNMGYLSVTNPSNASDLKINTTAFISNKPITITQITPGERFTTIGYTGSLQTLPEGNNHTITQQQNIGSNQMITVAPPRNEFGKYRWPGFDWRAYWPQTASWLFADEDDTGGSNTGGSNTGGSNIGGGNTAVGGGNTAIVPPTLFMGSKNVNASYDNLDDGVMVAPPPSNNNDDEDGALGMISW